jgi:hypothetical protein
MSPEQGPFSFAFIFKEGFNMGKLSGTSTLLTCIGIVGIVATAIVAAKNSTKARDLLIEAEINKGDELTTKEKVLIAAPAYIPTIAVAGATVVCVLGANLLSKRNQASMASAYALLDASYKEYRRKVEELYGEGADDAVLAELAKDDYEEESLDDIPEGEMLFWDSSCHRYFRATLDHVLQKVEMEDGMEAYIINSPYDVPASYWWG